MEIRLFTIPNLITLSNLLCGALATLSALYFGDPTWALVLILLAAFFDFFDGMAARMLGQEGPLGVQLDSLADDISFGLAPASLLYLWYIHSPGTLLTHGELSGVAVFLFAAAAALRLAKFNVDPTQHVEFCGLPSPAAAMLCASAACFSLRTGWSVPREGVLLLALFAAGMMVSPIRMFSFKFTGFGWRENRLRYLFLAVAAALLVGALLVGGAEGLLAAVSLVIALYVVVSTVRWAVNR